MPRLRFNNMGYRLMGRPATASNKSWHQTIIAQGLADVPDGTLLDVTPTPGHTYTHHTWPPRGRGRGESLYSPRRVAAKLRAIEVARMHLAGYTYQHIAAALGFADASGAYRAYRRMMDRIAWDERRYIELMGGQEYLDNLRAVREIETLGLP